MLMHDKKEEDDDEEEEGEKEEKNMYDPYILHVHVHVQEWQCNET